MKYSILLIKNRYTGVVDINKYAVTWFKTYANLDVEFNVIETNFDVTTMKADNATFHGVIPGLDIIDKLKTVIPENKYNAVVFLYGNNLNGIRVSSTNIMGANPLYKDTEIILTHIADDKGKVINHELFHAFFYKAKKLQFNVVDNLDTYIQNNNFVVDSVIDTNREIALQTLKPYWTQICAFRNQTPVQTTYKYFKPSEVVGLKPELVVMLDKMRGECGFPFIINSGYRTKAQNASLSDSVSDSAHLSGLAVDLSILDSSKRLKLIQVALANGIKRIGVGSTFIHLDISKTLVQSVLWTY